LRKKFRPAHFIDGLVGVLHDVELVIDNAAPRSPLLYAPPEGLPHIHARCRDSRSLTSAQFGLEEFIQGFFLPVPAEPDWLAALQIAHNGDELLLLAQMNFIHAHQLQCGFTPRCRPALQVTQIDGSHGAGRQTESPRYLPCRSALAGLAHRVLKPLAERGFAR
jgi:hypothetical protein